MKQYHDYKKQCSQIFFGLLLIISLIFPLGFSYAQTAQDIKSKINQKDSDIEALEKEIATYQSQLDSLGKEKNSLSNSIKELDLTKKKLNTDISVTQAKVDKTNLKIDSLGKDIGSTQTAISNNMDSIVLGIRQTDEFEQSSLVGVLLSQDDLTTMWTDLENMITIRDEMRRNILELRDAKVELEDTRTATVKAKKELTDLKSELSDQQKIVVQNTNEKNLLLKQTKNNEASYQSLLRDRVAKRDAFEKELRDFESQLQYILDPSKLPGGGVLSWPLASVFVTQQFGKTSASGRLYASGTHNGVDFRASVGTPIMAMADGTVLGTGDTDLTCAGASFGKYVFIRYNNGLSSTFGHLSLIKAKAGDIVTKGEVVGYSGATGHVTGPHLHVSLYVSDAVKIESKPSAACDGRIYTLPVAPVNAYLDALFYLPLYKI